MDKNITCFFTGHRDIEDIQTVHERTVEEIENLCALGYKNFISGGAVGFDTVAAKAVLSLRERYPDIKLYLYIPCEGQDKFFSPEQKAVYTGLRSAADGETVLSDHYYRGCMHARNRKMAQDSSVCIAYCKKAMGGTAYTVKYAKSTGIRIIYI